MNDLTKLKIPPPYSGPKPQGTIPDILFKIAFLEMMKECGFLYL